MLKRSVPAWLILATLGALPVAALDFHGWRTDMSAQRNSSIGQQGTNQATNQFDNFTDTASANFAIYWKGELQENGGNLSNPMGITPPFGDVPPTADVRDVREQDRDIDWATWEAVTSKTTDPPRPLFTPNVPQAWNPLVVDIDTTNGTSPDHVLINVGFEPPRTATSLIQTRDQVVNCYFPRIQAGLPGNNPQGPIADRGTVRPFWLRGGNSQTPGLRIRDLEPVRNSLQAGNPGVGVVVQPPIFARVPASYTVGGTTRTETIPVMYLVVGTGENGDFARVICVALRKLNRITSPPATPAQAAAEENLWLPDPDDPSNPADMSLPASIEPPNPDYFNPNNGTGGAVMWSYTVERRIVTNQPVPVAGIQFSNFGDASNTRPALFVTTADGQVICLNAKAADVFPINGAGSDGDPIIDPNDPAPRWIWESPQVVPADMPGMPELPGFHYGMQVAVARVPLAGLFTGQGRTAGVVTQAITAHSVSEWMVFAADTYGTFWAFDAPGVGVLTGNPAVLSRYDPQVRWSDFQPAPAPMSGTIARRDAAGNRERFIVPPLVYQGSTPFRNSNGVLVGGSQDIGLDDEVIFAGEKGGVYALDAPGRFQVLGTDPMNNNAFFPNHGRPTGTTDTRFKWPDEDTAFDPTPVAGADPVEPRPWPRTLPWATDPLPALRSDPNQNRVREGQEIANAAAALYLRSALAIGLGGDSNPDAPNPDLDLGDDHVYVPYLHTQGPAVTPGNTLVNEYLGSMKPYGFVQASRTISTLTRVVAKLPGGDEEIPLNRVRVGTIKANGVPSSRVQTIRLPSGAGGGANSDFNPAGVPTDDTIYITSQTWYDDGDNTYRTLPFGTDLEITYSSPTAMNQTETLPFPSCYRYQDPANPATGVYRSRASLGVDHQRYELRQIIPGAMGAFTATDEQPAEIDTALFTADQLRQPSIYTAGSLSGIGTVLAPSFFRGRTIAMDQRLRINKILVGAYDPRLVNSSNPPAPMGGYILDPGEFAQDGPPWNDMPQLTDVGGSITVIDGWVYMTYRNGHVRGLSNLAGAGSGTIFYPPIYNLPPSQSGSGGTLVKAPMQIRVLRPGVNPATGAFISATDFAGTALNPDEGLLLEWGQTINVLVDFGPAANLQARLSVDANANNQDIDSLVLEQDIVGQIRANGSGAVQAPANRGVRAVNTITVDGIARVAAVVPVFAGQPSGNNPLTPGTPLLWERDPTAAPLPNGTPTNHTLPVNFDGEVTYSIQITQPGVQWRWPNDYTMAPPTYSGTADPTKVHYWEEERASPDPTAMPPRNTRYRISGGNDAMGNPKWGWTNAFREYSPLVSYNNPIATAYSPAAGISGIPTPTGAFPVGTAIGGQATFTTRNEAGRKNGDLYVVGNVAGAVSGTEDGWHSGSGAPIVPVIGIGVIAGQMKQLLFGEHGKSTPPSTTLYPNLGKLLVADRSLLRQANSQLTLRVQPASLTKMGVGADFGTAGQAALRPLDPGVRPLGSFEQNAGYWDDSPGGFYGSIAPSRLSVTRLGTSVDLVNNPVPVPGRINATTLPTLGQFEQLGVTVDIPLYTPDDVYSTRWRTAGVNGADPRPTTGGGSTFNPFFPGGAFGNSRAFWDRAEKLARTASGQLFSAPYVAPGEDKVSPFADPNVNYDDRMRRVVIFNDANGDGQLTLLPNFREAYRTFAVQVMVKPDMKIDVQQQAIDFGAPWHGKKQPGTGANALDIREFQQMRADQASATPLTRSIGNFYNQYWRPFNLVNNGNVNLAYVKPEVKYWLPNTTPQLIGIPGEGLDAWRALSLINLPTPAALADPINIFLRTSFDDQLLPDANAHYGALTRGVWLQKAPVGSGQPASVIFTDNRATPTGRATDRDPSPALPITGARNVGIARDTWMALNIPTGASLGNYSGSIRFFNDRAVTLVENLAQPIGFAYGNPTSVSPVNVALPDSDLNRNLAREPLEPMTDPPLQIKVRVIENLVHGRGADAQQAATTPDPDRRYQPTAVLDTSTQASDGVYRLLLAYAGNRQGLAAGDPTRVDIFGTMLQFVPSYGLFPFDELPLTRPPWLDFAGGTPGWTTFTNVAANTITQKPSLYQDLQTKVGVLAWTERQGQGGPNDLHQVLYRALIPSGGGAPTPSAVFTLSPGGQPPARGVVRSGVRILPAVDPANPGTTNWLAIYALGGGTRKGITYSWTIDPSTQTSWSAETSLATSKAVSTADDPHVFVTDPRTRARALDPRPNQPPYLVNENTVQPQMLWMAYAGNIQRLGRTDVYLNRYRVQALTSRGQRGTLDQQSKAEDYSVVEWPRSEASLIPAGGGATRSIGGEVLRPNPTRTVFQANGVDWMIQVDYRPVQVYLVRPDITPGQVGSISNPLPLIGAGAVATLSTNDEVVFPLAANLAALPQLANQRIVIDRAAGLVRLPLDARTLARLALPVPGMTTSSPDPLILADYTPGALRITSSDASASDPVIVPVLSQPGGTSVMDASWYRQQLHEYANVGTGAWTQGVPVAGVADRLWVFWRRGAGRVSGGPTMFYKVLRPGVRVRNGQLYGVSTADLSAVAGTGGTATAVTPEEVNPGTGSLYFPATFEGQSITVTYQLANGTRISEVHYVNWIDESGERPVPMETSVNEGSLDAFATLETVPMATLGGSGLTTSPMAKMERIWLFWGSTRGTGGDLFYASLAPRVGPEANVGGSVTRTAASPANLARMNATSARQLTQQIAAWERRNPPVVPPFIKRGPMSFTPRAPARRTSSTTGR